MNSSFEVEKVKAQLLQKLQRRGNWEHRHTSFDDMVRAVPKDRRGEAKKIGEELIREGLIRVKPAFYGRQVSLNIERSDEIKALVRRYFGKSII